MEMSRLGLRGCRTVDAPPRAGEALNVCRGAGLGEVEQRGLVFRSGDAGQRPDLGVGDRPALPWWRSRAAGSPARGRRGPSRGRHPGRCRCASAANAHTRRSRCSTRCGRRTRAAARAARRWRHAAAPPARRSTRRARRSRRRQAEKRAVEAQVVLRVAAGCGGHAPSSHRSFCRVRLAAGRGTRRNPCSAMDMTPVRPQRALRRPDRPA